MFSLFLKKKKRKAQEFTSAVVNHILEIQPRHAGFNYTWDSTPLHSALYEPCIEISLLIKGLYGRLWLQLRAKLVFLWFM